MSLADATAGARIGRANAAGDRAASVSQYDYSLAWHGRAARWSAPRCFKILYTGAGCFARVTPVAGVAISLQYLTLSTLEKSHEIYQHDCRWFARSGCRWL